MDVLFSFLLFDRLLESLFFLCFLCLCFFDFFKCTSILDNTGIGSTSGNSSGTVDTGPSSIDPTSETQKGPLSDIIKFMMVTIMPAIGKYFF